MSDVAESWAETSVAPELSFERKGQTVTIRVNPDTVGPGRGPATTLGPDDARRIAEILLWVAEEAASFRAAASEKLERKK